MKQDIQNLRERTGVAEEDTMHSLSATMRTATDELGTLRAKLDDLEKRSRRNNVLWGSLSILRVPALNDFSIPGCKKVFGNYALSSNIVLERAHRTPPRPTPSGAPPHSLIDRILNFQDKVTILHLAREKGLLKLNGNTTSIYPDFSAEIQPQCTSFTSVKDCLRTEGLQYAMLFPAKLRIIHDGKAHFYTNPKEAMAWLDDHFGVVPRHRRT